jgi:hypothetical protein
LASGRHWGVLSGRKDLRADLLPRGAPVNYEYVLDPEWVEHRARFKVRVKLSSRVRPFESKVQTVQQEVINVTERRRSCGWPLVPPPPAQLLTSADGHFTFARGAIRKR